ncbi:MAG TPA: hypothetical protein PL137_19550, partial [Nocardioides sp.]|nr:hypothetical protein [Nocardioides sp.]
AGGVAAGVGGIAGFLTRGSDEQEPESPPTEQIRFSGDADVTMSALINHTWGTELLLDLSGLMPGTEYDVVFETRGGTAAAGSLLAVDGVVMKCRFNAAPLRADVLAIELRGPDGAAVLHSTLPQA